MASYNLSMIEDLAGDDSEFIRVMVEAFVYEVPGDIYAMNEAIDNENPALLYQIMHKISPNLQLFGLQLLPEIERLEAWDNDRFKKEHILAPAKEITNQVIRVAEELKKDFNTQK